MYANEYYFDKGSDADGTSAISEEKDSKPSQKERLAEDDDYEEQNIWQVSLRQKKSESIGSNKSWKTKFLD